MLYIFHSNIWFRFLRVSHPTALPKQITSHVCSRFTRQRVQEQNKKKLNVKWTSADEKPLDLRGNAIKKGDLCVNT